MKTALYLRVSTDNQTIENQRSDLLKYAKERDLLPIIEYSDVGISGAKEKRPGLDRLMDDARKKKFNTVLVWRFDRFARSTKHLIQALEEFKYLGIRFISYQENIDLSSPMGQAMFTIISAIAQLERDIIRERIMSGLRRARSEGKKLGRPATELDLNTILRLRNENKSLREIEKITGYKRSRVCLALRKLENFSKVD